MTDSDFPLIRALQKKGIDVACYIPLPYNFRQCALFRLNMPIRRMGIVKASTIEEMGIYKNVIDLDKMFFIQGFHRFLPHTWLIWIYAFFKLKKENADVVHLTWPFQNIFESFLFSCKLGNLKVLTVHDPFPHSGLNNIERIERNRKKTFNWADRFVLLNRKQLSSFITHYSVQSKMTFISRFGVFDYLNIIVPKEMMIDGDYILFWGQITPHKGLEYLLEAMKVVRKEYPHLKLVIAGGGNVYFDTEPYQHKENIWIHRFIDMSELVGLLGKSQFVICPYKDATQSGVVQTTFSMGVPVIATNVGALSETIKNNVTGFLVPPCDSIGLANKIVYLYSHQDELERMRKNIKSDWQRKRDWNAIADDYINKIYSTSNS